jgi:hypothetical protein
VSPYNRSFDASNAALGSQPVIDNITGSISLSQSDYESLFGTSYVTFNESSLEGITAQFSGFSTYVYDAATVYSAGDYVLDPLTAIIYQSVADLNSGNAPSLSPDFFAPLIYGQNSTIYNALTSYSIGDIVLFPGSPNQHYYSRINGNLGVTPGTDPASWGYILELSDPNDIISVSNIRDMKMRIKCSPV